MSEQICPSILKQPFCPDNFKSSVYSSIVYIEVCVVFEDIFHRCLFMSQGCIKFLGWKDLPFFQAGLHNESFSLKHQVGVVGEGW